MAKGIPSSKGPGTAPLKVKRLENVPIARIGAFRALSERKDDDTGETYEVEQVKLSIDFDSGHIQRNEQGEPVLDKSGNEQIHYINEGFTTLSGDKRAKLVEILKAIGFDTPDFIEQEGKNVGGLRDDIAGTIQLEFGTNGLGHDYSGSEYEDLPMYTLRSKGGKHDKRDVEVPVKSFKVAGYEVIGRPIDLALTEKGGWNRISAFVEPRDLPPLGATAPKPAARGIPVSNEEPEDPFAKEEGDIPFKASDAPVLPTSKHGKYIWDIMEVANIPPERMLPVARYMTGNPRMGNIADISVEEARQIRDVYKPDPSILVSAYNEVFKEQAGDFDDGGDEF